MDVPTSVRRQRVQIRFVLSRDEFYPGLSTNMSVISSTGWNAAGTDLHENDIASNFLTTLMLWAGVNYLDADGQWSKPNTRVEIVFTPASKQRAVGPNESVPVKTELRTKKEQTVIPAKYSEALELPTNNNGKVTPTQGESKPGTPATFTYKAPPKRLPHSGFRLKDARSRAGIADAEWELGESYVLEFRSVIVSTDPDGQPAQSQASADIRLEAHGEGTPGAEPKYSGQGNRTYQTGPLPNWDACTSLIRGQGTVPFRVYQAFIHVEDQQNVNAASKGRSAKIELLYGILGLTQETETGMPYYVEGKGSMSQWAR